MKIAKIIGKSFALVQDSIDRTVAWGFGSLKKMDKTIKKEDNKIIKAVRHAGGFIGETGSEFYKEYDRLKASRKEKDKDKLEE